LVYLEKYYLWTSITYFVGASAAMIIARFSVTLGFYGIAATLPTALIVYLTYRTYLKTLNLQNAMPAKQSFTLRN
jgi:hypothetical protein